MNIILSLYLELCLLSQVYHFGIWEFLFIKLECRIVQRLVGLVRSDDNLICRFITLFYLYI